MDQFKRISELVSHIERYGTHGALSVLDVITNNPEMKEKFREALGCSTPTPPALPASTSSSSFVSTKNYVMKTLHLKDNPVGFWDSAERHFRNANQNLLETFKDIFGKNVLETEESKTRMSVAVGELCNTAAFYKHYKLADTHHLIETIKNFKYSDQPTVLLKRVCALVLQAAQFCTVNPAKLSDNFKSFNFDEMGQLMLDLIHFGSYKETMSRDVVSCLHEKLGRIQYLMNSDEHLGTLYFLREVYILSVRSLLVNSCLTAVGGTHNERANEALVEYVKSHPNYDYLPFDNYIVYFPVHRAILEIVDLVKKAYRTFVKRTGETMRFYKVADRDLLPYVNTIIGLVDRLMYANDKPEYIQVLARLLDNFLHAVVYHRFNYELNTIALKSWQLIMDKTQLERWELIGLARSFRFVRFCVTDPQTTAPTVNLVNLLDALVVVIAPGLFTKISRDLVSLKVALLECASTIHDDTIVGMVKAITVGMIDLNTVDLLPLIDALRRYIITMNDLDHYVSRLIYSEHQTHQEYTANVGRIFSLALIKKSEDIDRVIKVLDRHFAIVCSAVSQREIIAQDLRPLDSTTRMKRDFAYMAKTIPQLEIDLAEVKNVVNALTEAKPEPDAKKRKAP